MCVCVPTVSGAGRQSDEDKCQWRHSCGSQRQSVDPQPKRSHSCTRRDTHRGTDRSAGKLKHFTRAINNNLYHVMGTCDFGRILHKRACFLSDTLIMNKTPSGAVPQGVVVPLFQLALVHPICLGGGV